jgi:hypothetical protein
MSPARSNARPLLFSTSHATPHLLPTFCPIAAIDRSFLPSISSPSRFPSSPSNPSLQLQADRPATRRPTPPGLAASKIVNATPRALPARHLAVGAVELKWIFALDQNRNRIKFIFFRTPSCCCFRLRPAVLHQILPFPSPPRISLAPAVVLHSTLPTFWIPTRSPTFSPMTPCSLSPARTMIRCVPSVSFLIP